MRTRSWLVALTAFLAFARALHAQEAQDTLYLKDNTSQQGEIVKESFKEVKYSLGIGGATSAVPREKIDHIDYDKKPSHYDDAKSRSDAGAWSDAAEQWDRVLKECEKGDGRKIFRQHAFYLGAVALSRLDQNDKAVERLNALLAEFPESQYFIESYNLIAECCLAAGKFAEAVETAKKAVAAGKDANIPEDQLLLIGLIKARALEYQGKPSDAMAEYAAIGNKAARFPEVANKAKLGQGRCLVQLQKFTDGQSIFKDLTDRSDDHAVLAGAYNGLGDCLRAQYEKENNPEILRKALLAYLHGVVLYTPGRGDDGTEHAIAMVNSGYCFRKLGDASTDVKTKQNYADWAGSLWRECIATYPGTNQAKLAENMLKKK